MDELHQLDVQDQELVAALKANRDRRTLLQHELNEQRRAVQEAEQRDLQMRLAERKPVTVLGASYENIRKSTRDHGLRVLKVHPDILKLLRAALPARDEQHFLLLCGGLLERVMGNQQALKSAIDTLKDNSITSKYFEASLDATVVTCVVGRLAYSKNETLAEAITAFCLEWGKITAFEEGE